MAVFYSHYLDWFTYANQSGVGSPQSAAKIYNPLSGFESYETSTHASDASSCAGNECAALREAFGDDLLSKLLILNTKGFTGHPMGVSFEDIAAVEVLLNQRVPPVANYEVKDDYLGNLKISKGGPYACRYAMRFAAGFGSQVAFALYSTANFD